VTLGEVIAEALSEVEAAEDDEAVVTMEVMDQVVMNNKTPQLRQYCMVLI
jgi:hypothetical protein